MDPTAPKDNPQNPNFPTDVSTPPPANSIPVPDEPASPANAWSPIEQPQSGGPQPTLNPDGAGPILPGQFVVSGQDSPLQPPNTQTPPQPAGIDNSKPLPSMQANAQNNPNPINHALDNIDVQDQLMTPPTVSPEPVAAPTPAAFASQPDPTPFAPPSNQSAPSGFAKPPGGAIKKLRSLILILGIIVLLIIIGAIAWFFFFSNQANQAASTENQNQSEPILEQQPIPKRNEGGFNAIQESSTPSGQLQQPTPAPSAVPTP